MSGRFLLFEGLNLGVDGFEGLFIILDLLFEFADSIALSLSGCRC